VDVSVKLLIIAILPQVYFLFEINTANLKKSYRIVNMTQIITSLFFIRHVMKTVSISV
jgi:hypothetical protein